MENVLKDLLIENPTYPSIEFTVQDLLIQNIIPTFWRIFWHILAAFGGSKNLSKHLNVQFEFQTLKRL